MDILNPAHLYEERNDVTWARPLFQGDVFRDIELSDFGNEPHTVQVITHPCAMRAGQVLKERLQVAPVFERQPQADWSRNLRVMPLPGLRETDQCYCTDFTQITSVRTERLGLSKRIATLSNAAIYALQRRLVIHHTRVKVPIEEFKKQARPVMAEMELQTDWIDHHLADDEPTETLIEKYQQAFSKWLASQTLSLQDDANHAALRRAMHQHLGR